MSNLEQITQLIEKAGKHVGSEYKLAKALGVPQQHLTGWKAGTRTCAPPDRARLAGFAREDAIQELVRATIDGAKGLKREQLVKVLGKLLPQTGGALHSGVLGLVSLICGSSLIDIPRCILC
jgi:DNA-binding transcriptional regulator YdaS (Cro superfamily)